MSSSFEKPVKPFYEPVLNDNEPKWLVIKKVLKAPKNKTEMHLAIKGKSDPIYETKFHLENPNVWQCNKCGTTIQSKEEPVECSKNLGGCGRNSSFKRITEDIMQLWDIPIWKDITEIDMLEIYDDLIKLLKQTIIFIEEIQYKIFALWIISTYKVERWNSVAFLIFRGLISSGKTRALELANQLGYRLMLATSASFPAMVRASHEYNAGLLLDEIDNKLDMRTEYGRNMVDFLKPSYKRGQNYFTADLNDQRKIQQYRNFGFKAFAGERGGGDQAMFSRSLDFQMEQDFPEIHELLYIQEKIDNIQTKLLNYRFKFNDPPQLEQDFVLKGRIREIFECIIATAQHIGIKSDDLIDYAKTIEEEKIEDFRNSIEWDILNAIKQFEEQTTLDDAPEEVTFKEIAEQLGWEYDRKIGQKIGYILSKKFFLKTKRKTKGTVLLLTYAKNVRKTRYLQKRYGLRKTEKQKTINTTMNTL